MDPQSSWTVSYQDLSFPVDMSRVPLTVILTGAVGGAKMEIFVSPSSEASSREACKQRSQRVPRVQKKN